MVEEQSAIAIETEDRSNGETLKDKDDGDVSKDREGVAVKLDNPSSDKSLTHFDASDTNMDTERTIPSQEDNVVEDDMAMRTGDETQPADDDADQSSAVHDEAATMVESKRAEELHDNTLVLLRHPPPSIPDHICKEFFGLSKIKVEDFNGIPDLEPIHFLSMVNRLINFRTMHLRRILKLLLINSALCMMSQFREGVIECKDTASTKCEAEGFTWMVTFLEPGDQHRSITQETQSYARNMK
jgi:hypothetical protein